MEYQHLYKKAWTDIVNLQENVQLYKQMLNNLVNQQKEEEEKYKDEILILNKIISDHHQLHTEEVEDLKEQLAHTKDALEMKEYLLQEKENKWKEFEDVIVAYAEDHEDLVDKLAEIDYLWDEVTSQRKISNVVKENCDLKVKINELESHLSEYMSSMTCENQEWDSPIYDDEPATTKYAKTTKLQFSDSPVDDQYQSGTMSTKNRHLEPPCKSRFRRSRFGSSNILEDNSNSTEECSKTPKIAQNYQTVPKNPEISIVPLEQDVSQSEAFKQVRESIINPEGEDVQDSDLPRLYVNEDEDFDDCLHTLSASIKLNGNEDFGEAVYVE